VRQKKVNNLQMMVDSKVKVFKKVCKEYNLQYKEYFWCQRQNQRESRETYAVKCGDNLIIYLKSIDNQIDHFLDISDIC